MKASIKLKSLRKPFMAVTKFCLLAALGGWLGSSLLRAANVPAKNCDCTKVDSCADSEHKFSCATDGIRCDPGTPVAPNHAGGGSPMTNLKGAGCAKAFKKQTASSTECIIDTNSFCGDARADDHCDVCKKP